MKYPFDANNSNRMLGERPPELFYYCLIIVIKVNYIHIANSKVYSNLINGKHKITLKK